MAWLAGFGLLVGAALSGCSAPASGAGAPPAPAASTPTSAAESFRSVRTYDAVPLPVRIRIPAAGVDSVLERLGRAPDGTMALPERAENAGWYRDGPRPGQPGPAVIIGHVDWASSPAVFHRLSSLAAGNPVYVDRADGSTATFRVTRLQRVAKSRFPTETVYAPTLEPSLRLITCGGSYDRANRNYLDNVIVYAAPA